MNNRCKHPRKVVYCPDGQETLRTMKGGRVRQWICPDCGRLLQVDQLQTKPS